MEGNRRPDEEGVGNEAWEDDGDNDAAAADDACSDVNDDEYGNVLVQPVVVAVLPIGSTGATKGSQDDDGDDGVTVCGVEEALDIASLDDFEQEEDGDDEGCGQFDAQASGGPVGNGLLPASWECRLASASVDGLSDVLTGEVQNGAAFQTEPLLAATCLVINCESLSKIIVEYWYDDEWNGWKRLNG